jgi:bacterioferritin-associated ferredoxin
VRVPVLCTHVTDRDAREAIEAGAAGVRQAARRTPTGAAR